MADVQRLNSATKPKNTLQTTQTALNNYEQHRERCNKILLARWGRKARNTPNQMDATGSSLLIDATTTKK
jgi:hypothetical protein